MTGFPRYWLIWTVAMLASVPLAHAQEPPIPTAAPVATDAPKDAPQEDAAEKPKKKKEKPRYVVEPEIDFSIFLNDEDVEKIHRALDIYDRRRRKQKSAAPEIPTQEEEDFLSKLAAGLEDEKTTPEQRAAEAQKRATAAEPQRPFSFPKLYLDSFIVRGIGDWVVWMNGQKYTPANSKRGDIEITNVAKNGVTIVWRPNAMDRVKALFKPDLYDKTGINIDLRRGVVEFVLNINQTIYTDQMKIIEGRMAPQPPAKTANPQADESAEQEQETEDSEPEAAPEPEPAPAPAAETAKPAKAPSGLEGIRQMYNNQIPGVLAQ